MQSITEYENNQETDQDAFVKKHLPLVKKIASLIKRKLPSHIDFDDLLQAGLIGLIEAKHNYIINSNASFETFASIRIHGSIIDSIRKTTCVNRETIKNMKRISNAICKIEQRDQRQATVDDIVAEIGVTHDEYFKMSQEINMLHVTSLTEKHINYELGDEETNNPEMILQKNVLKDNLKKMLQTLPKNEQLVLSLYYVEELTLKQIGEIMDLSEARVCQLHSQAISRIRVKLGKD